MHRLLLIALLLACEVLAGCARSHSNHPDAPAAPPAPPIARASTPDTVPWYEPEILAFETLDLASPPAPGQALFIGSSSIRMWSSLSNDMGAIPVLNRGFGGSTTPDVLAVFDRIVRPYAPRVIVYYCGDNDLGTSNTDADAAAQGFIAFDRRVRELWPAAPVLYISIKPSIARWSNWEAMSRANRIVRDYCERTDGPTFLDIASPMLGPDGTPDPSLFASDGLHLNTRGYETWTRVVRPALERAWHDAD